MNASKVAIYSFFVLFSSSLFAQNPAQAIINTNEVKAVINSNGALFWDFTNGWFITPSVGNENLSTLRTSGLWLAGTDTQGFLHGATQLYNESGKADFVPGTINSNTSEAIELNKIWHVTAEEIDQHRADFADNGIIDEPIANIYAWPARGNSFFSNYNDGLQLPSTNQGLAAFWDENTNGFYEPNEGDFPILEIRGCFESPIYPTELWWFVFHDNVQHTQSNLEPMKMEVQTQVFAYACEEETPINQTIFVRYKLIHRSDQKLHNTRFGIYSDFDIGNPNDDFFGSDAARSLVFGYNGDENDEGGYGTNPPVMAIDFLQQPLSEFGQEQSLTQVMPVPVNENLDGSEMYNLLSGLNTDGTPAPNDGFFYNGNPNNSTEPSEINDGNTPGERRVLASSPAFRLDPGAVNELILAYTFHQEIGQTPLQNITTMYDENKQIQSLFDNCFDVNELTCSASVGVKEVAHIKGKVFPNPTTDELNIWLEEGLIQDIRLFDLTGRTLRHQHLNRSISQYVLDLNGLQEGMYLLSVRLADGRIFEEKVVVMR